ncbi:Hsp20/alpha crystallin family protein [Kocuria sp. KH4]
MAGLMRREAFDVLEPLRRLMEGDLESTWPRVEEFQDGSTMVIRAELPGIDPDKDVELTVVNDTLHLRATRQERTEHKDKGSYRSEFHYGSFSRALPLPKGCREEDITAAYTDGVLEVRAPMREPGEQTSRKIPVTRRESGSV